MLKKDRARYIEALKQGLTKWRDYEEHPDKPVANVNMDDAICGFMFKERYRIDNEKRNRGRKWSTFCKYCFLYKKGLCEQSSWESMRPFWLMVFGDEHIPHKRGLHYPVFRGIMRRAIEDELRRVEELART
jgi:hypothetical protein